MSRRSDRLQKLLKKRLEHTCIVWYSPKHGWLFSINNSSATILGHNYEAALHYAKYNETINTIKNNIDIMTKAFKQSKRKSKRKKS